MKIIRDIHPEITIDKVSRLLGYRKKRRLSGRLLKNIDRSIQTAYGLIRPKIVYTEKKIERAGGGSLVLSENVVLNSGKLSRTLRKCDRAGVFIATIGKSIDSFIKRLAGEERMVDAYIFDVIGSIAAEDTVEKFHRVCDGLFEKEDEGTTLRFSPGYCDWKVHEQKKLFDMIDNGAIDVQLTSSCLMTPRKSVSGVFGIANIKDITRTIINPCRQCGMKHCTARRTEE